MSGRNAQVSRLFTVVTLLENTRMGLSAEEILTAVKERGHDVSWRTIYRDIQALQAAGFSLEHRAGHREDSSAAIWKMERASAERQVAITPRELLALFVSQQAFCESDTNPFAEDLRHLLGKFTAQLTRQQQRHLNEIRLGSVVQSPVRWQAGIRPEIMDTLQAACAERCWIRAEYESIENGKCLRMMAPQFIHVGVQGIYLIAYDNQGNPKAYAVSRFSSAELQDQPFDGERLDPAKYFAGSFGIFRGEEAPEAVVLHFHGPVVSYIVERKWHPSQQVEQDGEGCLLKLQVSVTPDLLQWILQFGGHVEVLSPQSLRDRIREEHELALIQYSKPAAKAA